MKTAEMINAYPNDIGLDRDLLARAVNALVACSQACTACADACLSEEMVAELRHCIRTDLDCADICATTARVLSRHTSYDADITKAQLQACIQACKTCGEECEQHSTHHEHCRICAEACHECEQACSELLASIG
ncbi:four-helix bundle copper-binding protein [Aeromicrobium phragmitis]|uniref:Four-helix bundle copper-binding protein n=1 Tax=Aeromicrobium phragmitis TaxID=2478914 RepID=A0A3L8PMM8_9ACTN|nr:four-helix bundle copper-binding protein [Aeromicrobium phragmitis]RLV56657.1 four-helix bundle copper-binding protein [Aeromicrobium phragmitis]